MADYGKVARERAKSLPATESAPTGGKQPPILTLWSKVVDEWAKDPNKNGAVLLPAIAQWAELLKGSESQQPQTAGPGSSTAGGAQPPAGGRMAPPAASSAAPPREMSAAPGMAA